MIDELHLHRTDRVAAYREFRNKLRTVRTYKSKKPFQHLHAPGDFLNAVRCCEGDCEKRKCAADKAVLLWFLEKLIREARVFDNGSFLLREPAVERFKPILHVGWGMDCFSETGFDYPRFAAVIETAADPKYRLLALEPVGMVYITARLPFRSFIIGMKIPPFPDPGTLSSFFDNFGEAETQAVSHGYGRGIYFKVFSLRTALREALDCPCFFNPCYAIRGAAFAYTMVNSTHLDIVFHTARELVCKNVGREECRYFSDGVASAVSFLEWNSPGLLESLEENIIVEQAGEILNAYRAEGGVYKL